jgi:hypothetical protein
MSFGRESRSRSGKQFEEGRDDRGNAFEPWEYVCMYTLPIKRIAEQGSLVECNPRYTSTILSFPPRFTWAIRTPKLGHGPGQ